MSSNPLSNGGQIADWCERNNYSRDELASELGVTRQTLFNWVKNQDTIPRVVALSLCALEQNPLLQEAKIGIRVRKKSRSRE